MTDTATRDRVRLEIGDTDSTKPLFNDPELDLIIDARAGNVLAAAADACDILATRFARDYDFEWAGAGQGARSKFNRSQMSKQYADRATALRDRAGGGIGVITTTRVDGYSETISARDGAGQVSAGGRTLRGYYNEDVPR